MPPISSTSQNPQAEIEQLRARLREMQEKVAAIRAGELRAEVAAHEAKELFQSFLEYSPAAVFMKDEEGRYVFVSKALEEAYQVRPGAMLGKTDAELWFPPETVERLRQSDQIVLAENRVVSSIETIPTADGISREWMGVKFPFRNAAGRRFVGVIATDITEHHRVEHELERQAALLDLAHDAIIAHDVNGLINFWNRGAEEMYGWGREEAVGKELYSLLQTEFPKPLPGILEELFGAGRWRGEMVQTARSGRRLVAASRWALHRDAQGAPSSILEIHTDTTQRRQAEDALQRANEALQIEVAERMRAEQEARQAEEALRELSARLMRLQDEERRRIARELHDSTTQVLSAIAVNLGLIRDEIGAGNPKLRRLLSDTQALADHAGREVRDLSHLLHPPQLEALGLRGALEWHCRQFTKTAGIRVRLDLPDELRRLPQEMELALFRIAQESLANVRRHSGSKSAAVRLFEQDREIVLEVKDSGRGSPIPDAENPVQGGIGLTGMRERLRHLQGRLEINSGGRGTLVRAIVPLRITGQRIRPASLSALQRGRSTAAPGSDK